MLDKCRFRNTIPGMDAIFVEFGLLTASFLVCAVVAVGVSVAHLALLDAVFSDAAVEVVLGAVRAVQLVAEVGAVHHAVAHAALATRVTQLGHAP